MSAVLTLCSADLGLSVWLTDAYMRHEGNLDEAQNCTSNLIAANLGMRHVELCALHMQTDYGH